MKKESRKKFEADVLSALKSLLEINNKQVADKMKKTIKKHSKAIAKKYNLIELKLSKKKTRVQKKSKK